MRNITLVSTFFIYLICLAIMLVGLGILASPFYLEGGVIGWYQGFKFDPKTNILGLQSFGWLVCNVLSLLLGAAIAIGAGFLGISLGITAASFRLLTQRTVTHVPGDLPAAAEFPPVASPFAQEPPKENLP